MTFNSTIESYFLTALSILVILKQSHFLLGFKNRQALWRKNSWASADALTQIVSQCRVASNRIVRWTETCFSRFWWLLNQNGFGEFNNNQVLCISFLYLSYRHLAKFAVESSFKVLRILKPQIMREACFVKRPHSAEFYSCFNQKTKKLKISEK